MKIANVSKGNYCSLVFNNPDIVRVLFRKCRDLLLLTTVDVKVVVRVEVAICVPVTDGYMASIDNIGRCIRSLDVKSSLKLWGHERGTLTRTGEVPEVQVEYGNIKAQRYDKEA